MFDYDGVGAPLDDFTVRGAGGAVTDGGTADAGTDAGVPPDAGVPDAGVSDAGTPSGALFYDGFNHTGSLGSSWIIGSGAFTDNGTAAVATASSSYAFWSGLPDRDASVSIAVTAPVGNTYLGVLLRAPTSSPTSDHYAAYVAPDGTVGIARRSSNVYSFLATGPAVASGAHVLSFSATGASPVVLSLRIDGVEVIHTSDSSSSLTGAGRAGMIDYSGSGHPIDDFTVRAGSTLPPDGGTPDAGTPDAGTPDAGTPPDGGTNPIVQENALAGSTGWQLTSAVGVAELGGYLSTDSAIAGDTVIAYVHSRVTATVRWELYRIGWYGGAGGRLIQQGQFTAGPQASCPKDSSTGLVECNWTASFSFAARAEWVSGVYIIKLTRSDGSESSLIFTLRDNRRAAVMVQQSVTTWQAYNEYGGESLYTTQLPLPQEHAVKVSFARPYAQLNGDFDYFEADFVRWLESQGFDLTYVTNLDFSRDSTTPQRAKVFLSIGHDEYWSLAERDGLEQARAAGVSQGYFTADEGLWQIRVEDAPSGKYRRLVCYKDASDPLYPGPQTTVEWRDPPVNRPENALIGVMSDVWIPIEVPFTADVPGHWLFAGTGMAAGDTIAQIEGYETDRRFDNGFTPQGTQRLAGHPLVDVNGTSSDQELTLYTASSGAIILGTGTIEWGWGLYAPGVADARLQRITSNFLGAAGALPATPRTLAVNQNAWARADLTGASSAVSTVAGVPGTHGSTDGAASQATFQRPGGIAVSSDGTIYVTDATASRIRKISNGVVSTLAGSSDGYADGSGSQAKFRGPQGLAIASDGSILVADTGNHCIRRVTTGGVVSTYAGACGAQGEANGSLGSARFNYPEAIAVGPSGAIYVADGRSNAIRKIASGQVSTLAASPNGSRSVFHIPNGLAVGSDETVYVVDSGHRSIKRVSPSGSVSELLFGFPPSAPYQLRSVEGGFADGSLGAALAEPALGIAVVGSSLYFSDSGNDRIRRIDLSTSRVTTFAGTGRARCEDGPGSQAGFEFPQGLAAGQGALYVADSCGAIRRVAIP
jgi:sugar lactone lactonase YvrE